MLTKPLARISIQSKAGETAFECSPSEPLLYAGLAQGLTLPYECATGTCGSCRGRVMSGEVENAWPEAPGAAAAKLKADKGDVLLCQTHARSDCVVRVPANVTTGSTTNLPRRRAARIALARRLTSDVMHLEVELAEPMSFEAGQFVAVETPDVKGGRAYSMVNHGEAPGRLSFVIKRKPGGGFSEWLFCRDVTGAELSLFGPLGRAVWRPSEDRDILAIAGGSGIAGMMAILEHATRAGHFSRRRGDVFFGVRTGADTFYIDELASYVAEAGGNLAVTVALSHEPVAEGASHRGVRLAHGFVHEVARDSMRDRTSDLTAFLAGPTPMVDGAIRMLLTEARLTPDRIRYDKFA